MTKKQWEKLTEEQRFDYAIHLGWKSCQGPRMGKAADKEINQIKYLYRGEATK